MYVAVKGGEKAILAAHALQEQKRRGDGRLPELSVDQIGYQLNLAVDRVMTEGGIADRELAALALKQASGDNVEATTPIACSILPCWPTAKRRLCSKPMAKQSRRRTSLACSRSRGWRKPRKIAARRPTISPAPRRSTPARVPRACSS